MSFPGCSPYPRAIRALQPALQPAFMMQPRRFLPVPSEYMVPHSPFLPVLAPEAILKPTATYHLPPTPVVPHILHYPGSHYPAHTYNADIQAFNGLRIPLAPIPVPRIKHVHSFIDGTLNLSDVIQILRLCIYSGAKQNVQCPICGKKYKSKVCLTKHLWEHTAYWSQFRDMKNHERVLCIQTALILTKNPYASLLVTAPCKKKVKETHKSLLEECQDKRRMTGSRQSPAHGRRSFSGQEKFLGSGEVSRDSFSGQENMLPSNPSSSSSPVDDFLHFTNSVNESAKYSSSPKEVIRRISNSTTGSTGTCSSSSSSHSMRLMTSTTYTTAATATTTTTTASSTSAQSTKNSPQDKPQSGDSGTDSGYGTCELVKAMAGSGEHDGVDEYNKATMVMEANQNKRLADFLEEHQGLPIRSGEDHGHRKTRRFDSDSYNSGSSCQPDSRSSSRNSYSLNCSLDCQPDSSADDPVDILEL